MTGLEKTLTKDALTQAQKTSAKEDLDGKSIASPIELKDILVKLLFDQIIKLNAIFRYIIGLCFALVAIATILLLCYLSFPSMLKNWRKFSVFSILFSFLESVNIEFFIIIGFISASLSYFLHPVVEKILLVAVVVFALYWSITNKQYLALFSTIFMIFYIIARFDIFAMFLTKGGKTYSYIANLTTYTSLFVIVFLILNVIFTNNSFICTGGHQISSILT
jgi:hypothetical protein